MLKLYAAGIVSIVILSGILSGCGSTGGLVYEGPASWIYPAGPDSLGLDEFLALSVTEQDRRRALAYDERVRAAQTRDVETTIRCLTNAAGLAPDDWTTWLALADLGRWVGDYVQTDGWLENAQAAVRGLREGRDEELPQLESAHWQAARRAGLARGWLHFDRGDWREGLRWVNTLARVAATDASVQLVRALLAASNGNRSIALRVAEDYLIVDGFNSVTPWIKATLDRAEGRYAEAFNFMARVRPAPEHAAVCYREMGEVAEMLEEYSHARRYYRESFHNLPIEDKSCIERLVHDRLGDRRFPQAVEFWVSFDRFYVTGSLSAYTAWAWDRYEAATGAERGFWAGQVVNGAGILIRKEMDRPWALRARGLVFLQTDELEKAITDLRRASRQLREAGPEDHRVEAALGHGLLLKERHGAALPHLRTAVALEPADAAAWADLGLALVMTTDRIGAEEALDRSLQLDPESATAWYNRGLLHLRAGEFGQAENDLTEAARLAPGNPEVVKLLQRAHSLQKRQERKNDGTDRKTE